MLRIWESRDRVGRRDILPHEAGGPSADLSTPHTVQITSQAQSASVFDPGIHNPVDLDSGPALFPGYPWGWPRDGIIYEVALPPNFEPAHIRAATNYFN